MKLQIIVYMNFFEWVKLISKTNNIKMAVKIFILKWRYYFKSYYNTSCSENLSMESQNCAKTKTISYKKKSLK